MCSKRDVIVFFAGAEFFHTLSHLLMPYYFNFPLHLKHFESAITKDFNTFAIICNGIITVLLLWWASSIKKKWNR